MFGEDRSRGACRSAPCPFDSEAITEVDDEGIHVGRDGGLDADFLPAEGVFESERLGMQGLAVELRLTSREVFGTVDGVAKNRMTDLGHVDANLVRAPGFEPAGDKGSDVREMFDDPVVRDRVFTLGSLASDTAPEVAAISDKRHINGTHGLRNAAFDDREVLALDVVDREKLLEGTNRLGSAREGERAGGIHIKPVHHADERAGVAVANRQILRNAIDQGVALFLEGRNRQEPRGLVDDDHVAVFMQDPEFGRDHARLRPVGKESNGRLRTDFPSRLGADLAIDVDLPVANGVLRGASRKSEADGDEFIETKRGVGRRVHGGDVGDSQGVENFKILGLMVT